MDRGEEVGVVESQFQFPLTLAHRPWSEGAFRPLFPARQWSNDTVLDSGCREGIFPGAWAEGEGLLG